LVAIIGAVGALSADANAMKRGTKPQGVATYVLTPIHMDVVSYPVPAEVAGPTTNNSCRNWNSHIETCYLPSNRLDSTASSPELGALLEKHLSGWLNAWKPGAYPADGASIDIALEQYASFEHLWLTYRVEVSNRIGQCWLDGSADPGLIVTRTATQPAAELVLEAFSGTRNASGFPKKIKF
jgi:hypothetical protein